MRKSFSIHFLLLLVGLLGSSFLALPALGQDANKIQELQRIIEMQQKQLASQQKQLEVQQKQLNDQEQFMQELQTQIKSLARDTEKEEVPAIAEIYPAKQPVQKAKQPVSEVSELSEAGRHDRDSPTGSNVTYFDPSKSINISGTKTDIGLHGFAEFQVIHDTDGLDNNRFDTATIPVDGAPSQTKFNVNPSQIALSSTTKVAQGRLNTMISMDFNGQLDRPEPRLRVAYGEFVSDKMGWGLLGGQTYTTMFDLRATPETLDFAGPAGLWQQRQPLMRLTKAVSDNFFTEFSIETPENVAYIGAEKRIRWPDFVIAGTWKAGGKFIKHLRMAGLIRDLYAEGVSGMTDSATGWAITGSAKFGLPFLNAKDNLKFNIHYGDGFGSQIKGGPTEGAFKTLESKLETTTLFGSYGGIQHFWTDKWRSNLVYGYVDSDNPDFVSGDTFDNTSYAAVDLIWIPYEKVTLGIEYLWGRRENKDGASGYANRFIVSSKVSF